MPDCGLCVSVKDRANPSASFNFLVPWQETTASDAELPRDRQPPPAGSGCSRRRLSARPARANTFTLTGVPFVSTAAVPIHPIPLTVGGTRPRTASHQVFGSAQTVLPVNVQIFPYDVPLPIDGLNSTQAAAAVAERASDNHLNATQYPIGVFIDGTPNLGGLTNQPCGRVCSEAVRRPRSCGTTGR